jgi:hypothetical protein
LVVVVVPWTSKKRPAIAVVAAAIMVVGVGLVAIGSEAEAELGVIVFFSGIMLLFGEFAPKGRPHPSRCMVCHKYDHGVLGGVWKCKSCQGYFCGKHKRPEDHQCKGAATP